MNSNTKLPDWMMQEEDYKPIRDRDGFVVKSIMKIWSVLAYAREERSNGKNQAGAPFKIFLTIFLILLTALSKNMFFTYCMLAGVLLRCAFLPARSLVRVVKTSLGVAILSSIILIPSVFLGSPHTLITISCKILISVTLVGILNETTPWNKITEGLGFFHVPDIFILTLDLTLKYIVILGDLCVELLQALKLRSVGKNQQKSHSMSGVLGATYLRSQEMAEENYQAMILRGFDGEYRKKRTFHLQKADIGRIMLLLLSTFLFIYLEIL